MNLLPGTVAEAAPGRVTVALRSGAVVAVPVEPGAVRPGAAVTLGIRPEALRPDPAGTLAGSVRLVERLGGLTLLHVAGGADGDVTVQTGGADPTAMHQTIRLAVDGAACHVFDADGQALARAARHVLLA